MSPAFTRPLLSCLFLLMLCSAQANTLDFGDLPEPKYPTTLAADGARHVVSQSLYLGVQPPDAEADGAASALASGDDLAGSPDDENAIRPPALFPVPGMSLTFPIKATNLTGGTAKIFGFADWNADGDFADANETSSVAVPTGSAGVAFSLPWSVPATATTTQPVAVRLRLSLDSVLGPTELAQNGEVEDFFIVVRSSWLDYGDLPDVSSGSLAGSFSSGAVPDYRTRAADNGPSHVLRDGLNFRNDSASGDLDVDAESDGLPTSAADGDDTNLDDDEVGLTLTEFDSHYSASGYLYPARDIWFEFTMPVKNTTGTTAQVQAFIDWEQDGDFTDDIDNIGLYGMIDPVVGDGSQTSIRIRAALFLDGSYGTPSAFTKTLAMRLRISTDTSLTAEGPASDGEVHDQLITLNFQEDPGTTPRFDYGDLPAPHSTLSIDDGARHLSGQTLFLGTQQGDHEFDGQPSALANGDDTAATNDEDALPASSLLPVPGMPITFPLRATNVTGSAAAILGFVDWNADGEFDYATELSTIAVPTGSTNVLFHLPWNVPLTASTTAPVAVRLRLTTDTHLGAYGFARDGEVEDCFIVVRPQGTVKDYGDLPDTAAGSAAGTFGTGSPPDYRTRAADGGPSHGIRPGLYFTNDTGSADADVDAESDGLPTSLANGDDLDGDDDEKGLLTVLASQTLIPDGMNTRLDLGLQASLAVTNTTGTTGQVVAFIDANSDGDFADAGEQAPAIPVPGDGSVTAVTPTFAFTIGGFAPATSFSRTFALRFRITTDTTIGSDGAATDGEVHDELITLSFQLPPYDTTDLDFGDLPAPYKTLRADNGARHVPTQSLYLGTQPPDSEVDGLPSPLSNGDDTDATDDENAIRPPSIHASPGSPITFPIKATNVTGSMAKLYGFADWNADGDFADADETSSLNVPNGSAAVVFNLTWNVPASASTTTPVAVRLRLSTATSLGPVGRADDGEVEDFFIVVRSAWLDYGDLPDSASGSLAGSFSGGAVPDYRTRAADNGPSHVLRDGLNFRNDTASGDLAVDSEIDGQPTAAADGDDTNFDDDEVGLTMTDFDSHYSPTGYGTGTPLRDTMFEFTIPVTNTTGTTAKVHAFVDWDEDGDFTDFIDNLDNVGFVQSVVGDGSQTTARISAALDLFGSYANPAAFTKTLAMRLRISTDTSLTAEGSASDGEVHDQLITLNFEADSGGSPVLDYGDLPAPYPTKHSDNGPRHRSDQTLYLGTLPGDHEFDGLTSPQADGDNTAATNDEDALSVATLLPVPGMPIRFPVRATNITLGDAMIAGFVDWNADGDFADTGETSSIVVPAGSTNVLFRLPWNVPATASTTAPAAVRLRIYSPLSTTSPAIGPTGPAFDGEVEDYFITVYAAGTVKDYGDLPDSASGTQTGSFNIGALHTPDYRTRAADNGPSHVLRPGLSMSGGAMLTSTWVDGESDGQPTAVANGDDLVGDADEETIPVLSTPGAFVADGTYSALNLQLAPFLSVTNSTGSTARLAAFIDLNSDGDFDDPGEQAPVELVPSGGSTPTTFTPQFSFQLGGFTPTPMLSVVTRTFATRYRLTTDTSVGPNGAATDGEVHDALLTVDLTIPPFSDADLDFGDLGVPFKTKRADNGARHVITPHLFLGSVPPDGEPDGYSAGLPNLDDMIGTDDEEGMEPSLIYAYPGLPVKFPVRVHNTTGGPAILYGFADWNSDGDFLDADETSLASVPDSTTGIVHLNWNVPASATITAPVVAVRLRIATATTLSDEGPTGDGEVEDYWIYIRWPTYDFDDLSDSAAGTAPGMVTDLSTVSQADYRTRLADNGPRHLIRPDLVLFDDTNPTGPQIDDESDGGTDSTTGPATESPVYAAITRTTMSNVTATTADLSMDIIASISVKNETGSTATLHGFMDANNDGDFTDAGESTSLSVPSAAGHSAALLTFTPEFALTKPITTFTKNVPIRFRLSTQSSLAADGPAPDGEVQSVNLTFSFTSGEWWPQISGLVLSELLDKGRNSRMDGSKHFGQGQQTSDEAWTIGQTEFTGPNPLLNTTFLDSLGTGLVQYSHRARFPDGSLHAYLGFLKVRDLSGYRSFMSTNQLTGDADTPHADSDGDGVSNFTEFAFGTYPGQSGQRPAFQPESSSNGAGGSHLVLPYLRRSGGTMNGTTYATPEVIYQPQASLDILSWDTPMEVPVAPPPGLPTPPSGYEWGAIRLNVPAHLPQCGFLRLNIDSP